MTIAHSPKWADAAQTLIDMTVNHPAYGEIPFTASPNDVEAHGRELYALAVAGEFGPIADYVAPPLTEGDYTRAVQSALDVEAKARGYDNILSACSYAAVANPFQAEGAAFLNWRSAVWAYCYAQLAAVQAGQPQPSVEALVAGIPALVLP
ncbi:MAG: hypothetical protein Q7U97_03710 [Rhodocyclaceae bacterium]|nr:hypothetical protein [Rhodocyclaceae bacterium]